MVPQPEPTHTRPATSELVAEITRIVRTIVQPDTAQYDDEVILGRPFADVDFALNQFLRTGRPLNAPIRFTRTVEWSDRRASYTIYLLEAGWRNKLGVYLLRYISAQETSVTFSPQLIESSIPPNALRSAATWRPLFTDWLVSEQQRHATLPHFDEAPPQEPTTNERPRGRPRRDMYDEGYRIYYRNNYDTRKAFDAIKQRYPTEEDLDFERFRQAMNYRSANRGRRKRRKT